MVLRYDQWRNFRFFGVFGCSFPPFCPDFLHLKPFKVGELPEVLVVGKVQGFVPFFKVNFHKIFPDSGVGLWANRTVNRHIGARRGGSRLRRYAVRVFHLNETAL